MNNCSPYRTADLQVLVHHIYEYNKGVRNMVLHTMSNARRDRAENILKQRDVTYYIQQVSSNKINIFFGNPECIDVVKSFGKKSLTDYTPEQDFILGIMLGYDRNQQCHRYMKMQKKLNKNKLLSIA